MKSNELLDQLTNPSNEGVESLVALAHRQVRRRRIVCSSGVAALLIFAATALAPLFRPQFQPEPVVIKKPIVESHGVPLMTKEELLDSFGEQPVALATYPDGSQRLLTIVRK